LFLFSFKSINLILTCQLFSLMYDELFVVSIDAITKDDLRESSVKHVWEHEHEGDQQND